MANRAFLHHIIPIGPIFKSFNFFTFCIYLRIIRVEFTRYTAYGKFFGSLSDLTTIIWPLVFGRRQRRFMVLLVIDPKPETQRDRQTEFAAESCIPDRKLPRKKVLDDYQTVCDLSGSTIKSLIRSLDAYSQGTFLFGRHAQIVNSLFPGSIL